MTDTTTPKPTQAEIEALVALLQRPHGNLTGGERQDVATALTVLQAERDVAVARAEGSFVSAMPTTAAERDVLTERSRQVVDEGWDNDHDDTHSEGELAKSAGCYAWIAAQSDALRAAFVRPPPTWPVEWDEDWWKPTDRRRDLVKAAALILAEIERLDRAALAAIKEPKT